MPELCAQVTLTVCIAGDVCTAEVLEQTHNMHVLLPRECHLRPNGKRRRQTLAAAAQLAESKSRSALAALFDRSKVLVEYDAIFVVRLLVALLRRSRLLMLLMSQ